MEQGTSTSSPAAKSSWRSPATATVAIAVAVNLLLLLAWLWSRGGQTTDIRLEANGTAFDVWLDGEHLAAATFPEALPEGNLVLQLEATDAIPSLPEPRGVDYVRVTSLQTGEVLYEEDFSASTSGDEWISSRGSFSVKDGHLQIANGVGVLTLREPLFADVRVDVRFHNVMTAAVAVRDSTTAASNVSFGMRPFRHYDGRLLFTDNGVPGASVPVRIEASRVEVVKSMLATLLSFIPEIYGMMIAGFAIVFALQFMPRLVREDADSKMPRWADRARTYAPAAVAAAIALAAFAVTLVLMVDHNGRMPHVPDEVSYLFQAKVLASGHLTAPSPPNKESFAFFQPPLIVDYEGRWFSVYPFGHTGVIAIGQLFGAPWLMPPIIGGLTIGATFLTARQVWNARTGMLAALLLAASPFFLMTASNFMSHGTAAFYIIMSVLLLTLRDRRPILFSAMSGVFFGLLFNTRPLTAVALVPPFGLLMAALFFTNRDNWKADLRAHAAWAVGALALLALHGLYNWGTTGDPFLTGYSASGDVSEVIGFGGKHSVAIGIQNEQVQLSMLVMVLHNWPLWIGLGLVVLPFMLGSRKLWDWFFLGSAVMVLAIYTLYEAPGIMHGPRYWYEAVPFLMLLSARGADLLATRLADFATWARRTLFGVERTATWAGVAVVYTFVIAIALMGTRDWLVGDGGDWVIDKMPARASELRGFNGANDKSLKAVEEANLENALVIANSSTAWQAYGTLFWKNSPNLDGNVIYARDVPSANAALFAAFPDRRVYFVDYTLGTIMAYGAVAGSVPPGDVSNAPRGDAIPTPTIAPTATPDVVAGLRRDEQRIADFEILKGVVDEYFARYNSYPPAANIQSLCVYSFDSGCMFQEVLSPLPIDPLNGRRYFYHSDGATFYYLVANFEGTPPPSDCPENMPPDIGDPAQLYCIRGP